MPKNELKVFAVARLREAARDCGVRKHLLKVRGVSSKAKVEELWRACAASPSRTQWERSGHPLRPAAEGPEPGWEQLSWEARAASCLRQRFSSTCGWPGLSVCVVGEAGAAVRA